MEHLYGWWNMDIRWHHYKHYQMPNLTLPCWSARRYDRIGHLVHPIRSPDAKVMQITGFGLGLCRGCRPAGPATLPNTSCLATRPLEALQWNPMHWTYKQIQKIWPKGLAHGLKDPFATLTEIFHPGAPPRTSCTRWSASQWNGGLRCANSKPSNLHRHQEEIRSVHEKVGAKRRKSQAGRPHFAASRPHLRMEATLTDPLAYNRCLGQIPTSS